MLIENRLIAYTLLALLLLAALFCVPSLVLTGSEWLPELTGAVLLHVEADGGAGKRTQPVSAAVREIEVQLRRMQEIRLSVRARCKRQICLGGCRQLRRLPQQPVRQAGCPVIRGAVDCDLLRLNHSACRSGPCRCSTDG